MDILSGRGRDLVAGAEEVRVVRSVRIWIGHHLEYSVISGGQAVEDYGTRAERAVFVGLRRDG